MAEAAVADAPNPAADTVTPAEPVTENTEGHEGSSKENGTAAAEPSAVDNRKFKYSREEVLRIGKAPGNSTFPQGLELVGPELRDLDKRVPYERGPPAGLHSMGSGLLPREASFDSAAGDAGPALKPSWALGRFGQANKQTGDATGKPPPPGFGLPVRSRLLDEGPLKDDEPQPQRMGSLGRLGSGVTAPWRGQDKEADRERGRERVPRDNWALVESPPDKGRSDSDLLKSSPPDGRRQHTDRWEKSGDSWRGGGSSQQPTSAKEAWRGGATDRWGGGGDERATARDTHSRRPGGGWGDEGHGERRRNDRQDAGDNDDGGIELFRAKGRGRSMTAAEMEAERLAFRKQLEAEKQNKAGAPALRGIYEHEEVDMNELMDESQKAPAQGNAAESAAPASTMTGPPGFSRPGYGVKMSFEQLAKAAAGGEAAPAAGAAPAQQQPAKVGIALDELEKQLNVGSAGGGIASAFAAQGQGAPPVAAPAGTFGFKADTNASMALLGMLNRGASGQGTSAPTPAGSDMPAAAAPLGQAAPPLAGEAAAAGTAGGAKAFAGLGLGALGAGGSKIPASVLSAFGEGAVKEAYAAFPSLSSIWGAPAGGLPPAPSPPAEAPAAAAGQLGMPPSTQAAAAALFEQLSNAAAAGTNARPPVPNTQQQPAGQQQQQQPQQQQQQASNALLALLQNKPGQQQQPGAPTDGGLTALLGQLNRAGGQTGRPPGAAAPAGDSGVSSSQLDDTFNSMFKDLGISPEPSKPKEPETQPAAAPAPIPGWPQQVRTGMTPTLPQQPQQQLPGQGGPQLTARALQDLLAATGQGQQRGGQEQQNSMQQLQQLLVNGQQRLNLQAALQQQQMQQQQQHLHQQQLHQQQQQQQPQQQWTSNMLHAMQQAGMRPGMAQQHQQQPGGFPANIMQQQQQQLLQQQMQQRMQQQQASQHVNMAAVMQAAQQQQQRPQGGFDPALLARLQGAMNLGGGVAGPVSAHPAGHMQGMGTTPGGNPLASALGIQHMMQMQQQLHAARAGAPQGGGMGGQAPAQASHDPNNLARFFNAAALQQAQAQALRAPQGAAMPTVADLERILGQRR